MKLYIVNHLGEAFTSRSSYDRPKFVKLRQGTTYTSEAEAVNALEKLKKYGTVGLSLHREEQSNPPNALKEFKLARGENGAVTDDDVPVSASDDMTAKANDDPDGELDDEPEDSTDADQEEEEQSISPRELALGKQLGVTYGKRGEKMFKGTSSVKEADAGTSSENTKTQNEYDDVKGVAAVSKDTIRSVPELITEISTTIKDLEKLVDDHGESLETAEGNKNLTALTVAKKIKDLLGSTKQTDFILLQVLINGLGSPIADKIPESIRFYAQSGGRSFKKDIVRPAKTDKVNESTLNEFVQMSYRIRVRGTLEGNTPIGTIGRGSVKIGGRVAECDSFEVKEDTRTITMICRFVSRIANASKSDIERAGVTVNGAKLNILNLTVSEGREV